MKKSFFLLPLAAVILTACSSNQPAPVVSAADSTELTPGVMQPVAGSAPTTYGWQSDIQPASMPTTMGSTSIPTPTIPQPVIKNPVITEQPAQLQTATKIVKKTKTVEKKVNQNFEIPRDANNAPVYSQIQKGFYDGSTYTVRKGDTMFLIAYIIGKDVKEIAALNNMSEPYQLTVGQKLKTGKSATETVTVEEKVTVPVEPQITYQQGANGTTYASDGNITGPVKASTGSASVPATNNGIRASVGNPATASSTATTAVVASAATTPAVRATTATAPNYYSSNNVSAPASNFKWQWPTAGRVVSGFSAAEGGNKGIDIAGSKGQDVKAAAAGKVVYAGNALEGYGNLIIIKHNDDFLSAYAHNDSIKVDEQDTVNAGDTIARMGSTGTNSNKLHFEIRYKGKSVDPTRYLPRK
ncbi:peptidoglycan DD-metalloendopeptidase family protein [Actinobacillus pleuropneumoniae]|uniref:Peptidase M23B n=1 Tax=Actinobacillus pleuropneumoniae serovar 6 str. Femo TaxID=754256 RepID=A0A828PFJ7_ACTPL|nr:peptidoglycan DD-metalloendopeptidase family protein [Actinobacillus pleuropneumoniae]EFM90905.1 Peptidase M23B [Actinobacillus pleuropneumoniae serovar 6 str. Femo]UKH12373.1 peptidoglycan DD-metalloendopeptidase family protein [Actinobacillus pleuropneumoniae serovar 6 str. Femo]SUU55341.1 Outer membrane antigenic lipoprotein B [Actinobacillus pleuropneumoniae]